MDYDVELMREVLLDLEARQTSPRMTIVIAVDDQASSLGREAADIETSLESLLDLDYIDGPGTDSPGLFLFRKLTRKGTKFVRTTRRPRDWERLKQHFAERQLSDATKSDR